MGRRTLPYASPERYPNAGAKEQSTQDRSRYTAHPSLGVCGSAVLSGEEFGSANVKQSTTREIRPETRSVVVGEEEALLGHRLVARDVNWLSVPEPDSPLRSDVRIRYRHAEAPATLCPTGDGRVEVTFDEPQRAITPGQAAVFYQGEVCIGGGWIEPPA